MYLKRLDIHGFKSFPDKVRFEFIKGITAVVGPNGSGKSNVADSIRWVLGEQSAKSLRGNKMEDVIFSGAAGRNPLGFAEVALTLDNTDGALNIDYSEVTVTRRVYRSGESEYQINGTVCRLKDIHELLMDTGIGREGYSIIGQGRVDELLSARAEDRRYIFEEAAGIVKFKSRKSEAMSKLEKERQNLIRINDIMTELTAQLEPLRHQSEIATRYLELKERLKILQVNIFLNETDRADKELKSYEESISQMTVSRAAAEERLEGTKAGIDYLKTCLNTNTAKTGEENENMTDIRLKIEQRENDIKLKEQRISHIEDGAGRLKSSAKIINAQIGKYTVELNKEHENKTLLSAELVDMTAAISKREKEFKLLAEQTAEDDRKIANYNREIIEAINESSAARTAVNKFEASYEALSDRKERIQDELNEARELLSEKEIKLTGINENLGNIDIEINRLRVELKILASEGAEYKDKLRVKAEESQNTQRELSEASSRHRILCDLEHDYEGYARSVKAVFALKTRSPERFSSVLGTVGELLSVPGKYEVAIEIALGGAIQNIVVTDEEAAALVIKYLKESNSGRATFLPLSAMRPKSLTIRDRLSGERGFIGTASELAEYKERYKPVVEHLLGRVAVVDSMENAVIIFKKYKYDVRIVTLDGELLNPGGAISGGSIGRKDTGIISRGRQIKALAEKIDICGREKSRIDGEIERLRSQLDIVSARTDQFQTLEREYLKEQEDGRRELNLLTDQLEALRYRISAFEAEDGGIMDKLIELNTEIHLGTARIMEMERAVSEKEKSLEEFERALLFERESKNANMLGLMELKAEAGALEQKIKSVENNIIRIDSELQARAKELEQNALEAEAFNYDRERLICDTENDRLEVTKLIGERDICRERINSLTLDGQKISAELDEKDERYRVMHAEMSVLNTDIARMESKKEQLETDARRLYDNMWDEYKITYITAKEYPRADMTPAVLNREEKKVRNEISGLGGVNVQAIEEYKVVKARYDFLSEQRNDIAAAEEKLGVVIKELTELMEKRFMEQFAKISENFSIVFKEIFGGGNAYLRLSDKSCALSSGIEIISQPPGKTLSNMNLLSGGEHALTAIALLFGILRLKPSPFCVLDEIESALDDANVGRFANYLSRFSDGTQFVIITHRKKTMEAADVLYGITMQEQGVSKQVSVRFTEEAV